nr:hypothetical protein Iba_chr10eCG5770 [Ipomoea batatas]
MVESGRSAGGTPVVRKAVEVAGASRGGRNVALRHFAEGIPRRALRARRVRKSPFCAKPWIAQMDVEEPRAGLTEPTASQMLSKYQKYMESA